MSRKILGLVLVSLIVLAGCVQESLQAVAPKETPSCTTSEDCQIGRYCHEGKCLPYEANISCTGIGDCSLQEVCRDGRCVAAIGWACEKNEECGEGQACKDGYCAYYGE